MNNGEFRHSYLFMELKIKDIWVLSPKKDIYTIPSKSLEISEQGDGDYRFPYILLFVFSLCCFFSYAEAFKFNAAQFAIFCFYFFS